MKKVRKIESAPNIIFNEIFYYNEELAVLLPTAGSCLYAVKNSTCYGLTARL